MKKRDPFLPVGAIIERRFLRSGGVLANRECLAGMVPESAWARIMGRKVLRQMNRVRRRSGHSDVPSAFQ